MVRQSISQRNSPMPAVRNLTPAMEDYLKAIYLVGESGDVTTRALAAYLRVAPPSVTEMMQRLADHGFVEYTPYHHISLTIGGKHVASDLAERYRLLAGFLVTALGYPDDFANMEADRLEHAVSDRLRACIAEYAAPDDPREQSP